MASPTSPRGIARGSTSFGKVWALVNPYWRSDEKWVAWGLLLVVVALELGGVYGSVLLNSWYNDFYNALQNKDFEAFLRLLARFGVIVTALIASLVFAFYLRQLLSLRWRRWLTGTYVKDWLADRAYYRLELTGYGADNPEQRIQEDLKLFSETTLSLGIGLLSAVTTLVSFTAILWGLSGSISFSLLGVPVTIPGYMVFVAVLYAVVGSFLTHVIGRRLIRLNFEQERYEADFRLRMIRLRDQAESVALYRGEEDERARLGTAFGSVWRNYRGIMTTTRQLNWFVIFYSQAASIFPLLVAAPRYFSGAIQLGGLMQISSAFGQVQSSLSWFVSSYTDLASWKASVDRLTTFNTALDRARKMAATSAVEVASGDDGALRADGLDLALPDGRVLVAGAGLAIRPGERVLIAGPSGSGKSTLFKALAGLWPFGKGRVTLPEGARVLFLPQRPYLPQGTLGGAVGYPASPGAFTAEEMRAALEDCRLAGLADLLEEEDNWSLRLSPGEQQRLAFARALLTKPDWLFLDEATSALDADTERHLYTLVRERLPRATLVSIAHRPTVAAFHERTLRIEPESRRLTTEAAAAAE